MSEQQPQDARTWRDDFTRNRVIGFFVAMGIALFILPAISGTKADAERTTAQVAARSAGKPVREALTAGLEQGAKVRVALEVDGPEELAAPVKTALQHEDIVLVERDSEVTVKASVARDADRIVVTFDPPPGDAVDPETLTSKQRVGGYEALMPPLIAILIALFFRRVLIALALAVWTGGVVSAGGIAGGTVVAAKDFVWGSLSSTFNVYIIGFTLMLVGMIQILTQMGGIAGLLDKFRAATQTKRSARVTTALMGTAIFFDDYANTIVVGTSMRPITDARRISREKLAYLVDSMSAPIAGLAIISTWVGYEVGLFGELSTQLGLGRSGYDIFFSIIGLRFYCLFTIVFVLVNAYTGRDFGPMLLAERRAEQGLVSKATTRLAAGLKVAEPSSDIPHRWWNAVVPIVVVIVGAMFGMFYSGYSPTELSLATLSNGKVFSEVFGMLPQMADWTVWRESFSNADSAKVLFFASTLGTLVALGLALGQRLLSLGEALRAFGRTVPMMYVAIAILVLAWSIRAACDDLGTSTYLVGVVGEHLSPMLVPLLTFLLAAVVASATGTSWGTMGILLPAMVPLAYHLSDGQANAELILLLTFGAVLDGAIFGDHCSPISDTTVMSSIASSCDHLEHVRTQIPYAVCAMVAAAIFGYTAVAFGLPPLVGLAVGAVAAVAPMWVIGRRADGGGEGELSDA